MAAVGPSLSAGEKGQWQELPQPTPSQTPVSGSNAVPMTEEELEYSSSSTPGPSFAVARVLTPPPYSGPVTPVQAPPSPGSQDDQPIRYPGLPALNYRLYRPPLFDLSADKTTIKTTAAHLSSNAAALVALVRQQATIPPKLQIRVVGKRYNVNSNGSTDFDIKLNLLPLLVPDDPRQRMDYIRCVAPGELAYRGGTKPSTQPDLGDGGGGGRGDGSSGSGLEAWAAKYVADSASVKVFVLERLVVNFVADWIEVQIRKLVASMRYPGTVTVTFPTTHTRVVVQSPDKVNKFITSVTGFFAGKKRYEVVKAVWPFANIPRGSDPGDDGRRCAVQSEETWWKEWREPIRYGMFASHLVCVGLLLRAN
jgi:hypothetical protein